MTSLRKHYEALSWISSSNDDHVFLEKASTFLSLSRFDNCLIKEMMMMMMMMLTMMMMMMRLNENSLNNSGVSLGKNC